MNELSNIQVGNRKSCTVEFTNEVLLNELLQPFSEAGSCELAFIHRKSPVHTFNWEGFIIHGE
ncbi:hypothetical protein PMSD_12875 [Paenibacillus macquariensis subsp. defensor]|nr:hypothetical protein PMSD_12875 [Paenibacillus macquariensis subsp. defensor]